MATDMAALLQAAELLRLEEEGNLDHQTLQQYGISPENFPQRSSLPRDGGNFQHERSASPYSEYGNGDDDKYDAPEEGSKTRKRSVKNREMHNMLEKNRRAHLKNCFDNLRDAVPGSEDIKQSTVAIIQNATKYIEHLNSVNEHQVHEIDRIRRLNQWCAQRLRDTGAMDADEFASVMYENAKKPSLAIPDDRQLLSTSAPADMYARRRSDTAQSQPSQYRDVGMEASAEDGGERKHRTSEGYTIEHHSP